MGSKSEKWDFVKNRVNIFRKVERSDFMRSQWVSTEILEHILAALMPPNRLICEISLATGLRVGDVLRLRPSDISPDRARFTIKEEKTGKARSVYLPLELRERAFEMSGRFWVFEHRCDRTKHRTRQAVFKDIRRAAMLFRVKQHISPHSVRKAFAVDYFNKHGRDLRKIQKLLNHSNEAVTMLYAMADKIG